MPKTKNEKVNKNTGRTQSQSHEMFGVSTKRSDEIINAFKHALIDNTMWTKVWETVSKTLKGEAEFAFAGYIFARMYEAEERRADPIGGLLEGLMKHTVPGHKH